MWEFILTLIAKLGIWTLEKMGASKEAKERFYEFIKQAANDTKSTKLMEIGRKQRKWLDEHPWPETNVVKDLEKTEIINPIKKLDDAI